MSPELQKRVEWNGNKSFAWLGRHARYGIGKEGDVYLDDFARWRSRANLQSPNKRLVYFLHISLGQMQMCLDLPVGRAGTFVECGGIIYSLDKPDSFFFSWHIAPDKRDPAWSTRTFSRQQQYAKVYHGADGWKYEMPERNLYFQGKNLKEISILFLQILWYWWNEIFHYLFDIFQPSCSCSVVHHRKTTKILHYMLICTSSLVNAKPFIIKHEWTRQNIV